MLHYLYYPFPQKSVIHHNKLVIENYTNKYSKSVNNSHDQKMGDQKGQLVRYKGASLKDIENEDMLSILSHGGQENPTIIMSDRWGTDHIAKEQIKAVDLAKQLSTEPEKLPLDHVLIKMLSCYAAGVLTLEEGKVIARSKMGESGEDTFAKLLAIALKKEGYNKIIVGGYAGAVLSATVATQRYQRKPMKGNAHQYNRVTVIDGTPVDAHDHIHWVDGTGNTVLSTHISKLKRASDEKQK